MKVVAGALVTEGTSFVEGCRIEETPAGDVETCSAGAVELGLGNSVSSVGWTTLELGEPLPGADGMMVVVTEPMGDDVGMTAGAVDSLVGTGTTAVGESAAGCVLLGFGIVVWPAEVVWEA